MFWSSIAAAIKIHVVIKPSTVMIYIYMLFHHHVSLGTSPWRLTQLIDGTHLVLITASTPAGGIQTAKILKFEVAIGEKERVKALPIRGTETQMCCIHLLKNMVHQIYQ
jgi:hypothetical protein